MPANIQPDYNEEKFKELIVYVSMKCEHDTYFSATKLNKILFYSDFLAYKVYGKPITGADYFALPHGPAPRRLVPVRESMKRAGDIAIRKYTQHRVIPLRNPDYDIFEAREIALVDRIIDILRDHDAEEVSEITHLFLGWQAAMAEGEQTEENVSIPYQTVFIQNPEIDEYEEAYAVQLAKKHGWGI